MNEIKNIIYLEANEDGTIGGSHYCLLEIIKKLDRSKYKPFVCFYQRNVLISEFERFSDVLIIEDYRGFVFKRRFPEFYCRFQGYAVFRFTLKIIQKAYNFARHDIFIYVRVIFLLRRLKVDLVHINNAPLATHWLVASKILGIKCISHIRGNPKLTWAKKELVKYYDKIISISHSVTEESARQGIDTKNFITIHDGIDVDAVLGMRTQNSCKIRNELGISKGDQVIGDIGNIKDWKGQHVLIEAISTVIKAHPNIKCLFVGAVSELKEDRDYYECLLEMVKKLGLESRVIFAGYREDVPDLISILDIMVHTSTEPEPLGRVVLEGMLLGKPVVATAHGGPLEVIEDKISGFLVEPSDPVKLAAQLVSILENLDAMDEISVNAKKRVDECFSINLNVNKIESLYRELLKQ